MGKLAFGFHDREKISGMVEQLLREETGAVAAIPYVIETGDANTGTAAVLDEVRRATMGGQYAANRLFTIHFQIARPRAATLDVPINRTGIGAYAGGLLYATTLTKSSAAEVHFEPGKTPRFVAAGADSTDLSRLNGDGELVRQANAFLRARMAVSGVTATITPFLRLVPQPGGTLLLAYTLPKWIKFGFASLLDARAFFDLAARIEKAL